MRSFEYVNSATIPITASLFITSEYELVLDDRLEEASPAALISRDTSYGLSSNPLMFLRLSLSAEITCSVVF